MSEWKQYKIADLIEQNLLLIGDGYRAKNSELYATPSTGIAFARVRNIDGGFDFSEVDFYPLENLNTVGAKISQVGDTVFTSKGTVGRFAFVTETTPQFVYSPQLCFWRTLDDTFIVPRFLFYWMQGGEFLAQVEAVKGQTDMADYVNLADQRQMKLTLPPLEEQKAIAAVLSSLDDKIDLLQRQNKTLETLAQTLFRHWFVDEADDDWDVATVGEVTTINANSIDRNYQYREIEYLDTGSITDGKIDSYQLFALSDAPSRAQRLVKHNDVIISTVRPNQKHYGIIKNPKPNTVVSTGFCVLTSDKVDPHFIYILLTQPDMTKYLHIVAEASTSAYPSLKPSDIANIEFPLPPPKMMEQFAGLAGNMWIKIEKNDLQVRTLERLRDTLLTKLISGEVSVTCVPEIVDVESHELFDRVGYLTALFAKSDQPVSVATVKAQSGVQETTFPRAWFAIPETLYQLSEQPFPTPVGQTIYQKICYVLTDEGVNTGFTFAPRTYGPHSNDAVQALSLFETMGIIEQAPIGRMTEVRVQELYRSQRGSIIEELKQFQPMITRTVELFNHIKDTDHAEEIATILFSARQIEHKLAQRNIPRSELHKYMITWKPHWDKKNKRERLDRAINGLVKLDFIAVS